MCYAIPGKVTEINNKVVWVDYFGQIKKAINEFYDLQIGDYILAQGGFVIRKVPAGEAKETLSAWSELFFQLQDIDLRFSNLDLRNKNISKKLQVVLDKSFEGIQLTSEELLYLFGLEDPNELAILFKAANYLRQKFHKNSCCVHGIIEVSNYCQSRCQYCGISDYNKSLNRYRMSLDEIVKTAVEAVRRYRFGALVLQSGQDPGFGLEKLCEAIKDIKRKVPVLICISFGEVGTKGLKELYQAGARGLLLRFETSNPELFARIHPSQKLKNRLFQIKKAADLGYLVMTGALIGLPGQTDKDIINDIHLAKSLEPAMYSFGPFLPHPNTPLSNFRPASAKRVLKTLALARFIDPENAKILVTTAFETLDKTARKKGMLSGANSLMLNVTPPQFRKDYSIYPDKAYSNVSVPTQINEAINLLKSLGRAPTDLGVG